MNRPAGVQLPADDVRPGGEELGGQNSPSGAYLQDSVKIPRKGAEELDQGPGQGAAREVMLAEGFPQWGLAHRRTVSEAPCRVPIWPGETLERIASRRLQRRKSLVFLGYSSGVAHGTPLAAQASSQE